MITPKELLILRASLRYAIEELGPHCPEGFAHYLPGVTVAREELFQLLSRLESAKLLYARIAAQSATIIEPREMPSTEPVENLGALLVRDPG